MCLEALALAPIQMEELNLQRPALFLLLKKKPHPKHQLIQLSQSKGSHLEL